MSSRKHKKNELENTDSEEEEDAYNTPKRAKFIRSSLTKNSKDQRAIMEYIEIVNRDATEDEKQLLAYTSGKRRKEISDEENAVKDVVKKHIISRATFLEGEGLEPNIVRIQMKRRGRGHPLIGENHDFPDLVNPKGIYRTILKHMKLSGAPIEKKVMFWVTWRKTIGNCIKVHRNAVTSKMKNAILKGMLRYS